MVKVAWPQGGMGWPGLARRSLDTVSMRNGAIRSAHTTSAAMVVLSEACGLDTPGCNSLGEACIHARTIKKAATANGKTTSALRFIDTAIAVKVAMTIRSEIFARQRLFHATHERN